MATRSRGLRSKGRTQELLDKAEQLGVNINQLINKVLDEHLETYWEAAVKERKAELRKMLNTPV